MRRALLVFIALVSVPRAASPQGGTPLGPEFRVNTYTTNQQRAPSVAADPSGNFVVAWYSYLQDGFQRGVFAQRYASTGAPLGGEFRVNTYTFADQDVPSVASDSAGNFVIAWVSYLQDGSYHGVFAQRYASTGAPLGGEFRVNSYTTSFQYQPSVASDSAGKFVVAWSSYLQDGDAWGIFAQRYASTGAPLGGEFRVNTYTTNMQYKPSVASDSAGNFVIAWQSNLQDGSYRGVFAQRYASTGAPLGGEFRVNSDTTGDQYLPTVASDSAGNFVVAWTVFFDLFDPSKHNIFAQRFASTGAPLGGAFRVNSYTTLSQFRPTVASDSAGNFVVAWFSYQDGDEWGIFAQRYASTGAPLGGEFRVNSYTTNFQTVPSVASDSAGNFVIAWQSDLQDGSSYGVFAQRYSMIVPPTLSVADVTVIEGDAGTVPAVFTVSLSAAAGQTVTVQYATADGTATAGSDYAEASGTVTFPPGTVTVPVAVSVLGDLLDEDDETFTLNLSNPTGATIADGQGLGTITDNDPLPFLFAGDCAVVEGNSGSTPCAFTVTLAPVSGRTVTVAYIAADGTATAGSDYTPSGGVLTFPAGTAQQQVNVAVLGDIVVEPDETFLLNLSAPSNAAVGDGQGTGTILDDDAPSLSSLEVSHGTDLRSDLAGGTADIYRLSQRPLSSYEAVLDDVSADAVPGLLLQRLAADNTTVLQTATSEGTGSALSLRWENTVAGTVNGQSLRLSSPACGSGCGTDDVYRLRVYDTTFSIARFNNTGSQVTVIVMHNPRGQTVSGHIHFWSVSGALLWSQPLGLAPRATLVLNTAGVPGLQGQGGSVSVAHDGPYGVMPGKTVALEPATGFSFDSPLEPRR